MEVYTAGVLFAGFMPVLSFWKSCGFSYQTVATVLLSVTKDTTAALTDSIRITELRVAHLHVESPSAASRKQISEKVFPPKLQFVQQCPVANLL